MFKSDYYVYGDKPDSISSTIISLNEIDGGFANSVYGIYQYIDGGFANSVYTTSQYIDGGNS